MQFLEIKLNVKKGFRPNLAAHAARLRKPFLQEDCFFADKELASIYGRNGLLSITRPNVLDSRCHRKFLFSFTKSVRTDNWWTIEFSLQSVEYYSMNSQLNVRTDGLPLFRLSAYPATDSYLDSYLEFQD